MNFIIINHNDTKFRQMKKIKDIIWQGEITHKERKKKQIISENKTMQKEEPRSSFFLGDQANWNLISDVLLLLWPKTYCLKSQLKKMKGTQFHGDC